jgi:fimbrial chaperone protein
MKIQKFAIAVLLLGCASIAYAGSLTVSPVRIDLNNKKSSSTVQVTNQGDAPVTVQARAVEWRMDAGENKYEETNDFIVSPPVFTLQPQQRQMIRLGIRGGVSPADIERTYRLILEEVPKAPQAGAIAMVFNISVPVFLDPARPVMPLLIWDAAYTEDGALRLTVTNDGTAHDYIKEVVGETNAGQLQTAIRGYVLPGHTRDFIVRDEHLRALDKITLNVLTDGNKARVELVPQPARKE